MPKGGTAASTTSTRPTGAHIAASVTGEEAARAQLLVRGEHVNVSMEGARRVVAKAAAADETTNVANMHIESADHGNLFDYSATETPREQMPQIPTDADSMLAFSQKLADHGITARLEQLSPQELHATQNELDADKVDSMVAWMETDEGKGAASKTLIASAEGAILDGHHRWGGGAIYSLDHPDYTMSTLRTSANIDTLLSVSREFDAERGIKGVGLGVA